MLEPDNEPEVPLSAAWDEFCQADTADKSNTRAKATLRANVAKAAEGAPAGVPFKFFAVGDLELKEPEFLIDGLIEADTLGLVFGDPGCGKTFVAVDMAMCIATGTHFHGHPVKRGPVFYIAGEGHNGLARRFAAWGQYHSKGLTDVPVFKSSCAAQFLNSASAKSVTEAVEALAAVHGLPALIAVDTLARNFGGGDENSTKEMGEFINAMDQLRINWPGAVILIVHHSGHADKQRARGSMALKGALDFEYRLNKNGNRISMNNTKMKDADSPATMWFELEAESIGEVGKSAVLVMAGAPDDGSPMMLGKNAKLARDAYIAAAAVHGVFVDNGLQGMSDQHWRSAFYEAVPNIKPGSQATAFRRSQLELQNAGLITERDGLYLALAPADLKAIEFKRGGGDKTDTTRQN